MTSLYPEFNFEITYQAPHARARLGRLKTPHGPVETPAFIFCATKAAMKGLSPQDMVDSETQIILSNTYHLMLQPGGDLVEKMGGLHSFMNWKGPMLTDSGGFQIFSLGYGSVASEIKGKRFGTRQKTLLRITEQGAQFKSYLDGSLHLLTPERSIEIQRQLGADLIVVLDECTPYHVDKDYTKTSMELSHRWALRCLEEFQRTNTHKQALYGIVQGGIYPDLRQKAAEFITNQPFFGYAIGGSLGATKDQMHEVVGTTLSYLSPKHPVHLLGIGGVEDIFNGVQHGIDTFDCVHPTRLARHGGALVKAHQQRSSTQDGIPSGHLNLRNAQFREDPEPIDSDCPCRTCKSYSRAYLHHLFKAKEMLGIQAVSLHNVTFMNRLLKAIRQAISHNRLEEEKKEWITS